MEWGEFLRNVVSSALVGGLASATVNHYFTSRREKREHDREREIAATNACEALEHYTRACIRMIEIARQSSDEAVARNDLSALDDVRLPPFEYPETIGWKWLDKQTRAELREFPMARKV